MNLLHPSTWFRRSASLQAAETSGVSQPKEWLLSLLSAGPTKSGAKVSPDTAMRISAVYRCISILANTAAMLPLILYRRIDDDRRERATDHPLYKILRHQANGQTTAFRFKQTVQAHLSMRGNGYAEIIRDGKGVCIGLVQKHVDRVKVRQSPSDGSLFYDFANGESNVPERRMLHLRGLSLDGMIGLNPIELARESFGVAIAAETAAAEVYGQGAIPAGILSVSGTPQKEQRDKLRGDWKDTYGGKRNDIAVLGDNAKFEPLKMNLQDLQFIESRNFQIKEIGRLFGVPPQMLYDLDRATFNNHEHQGIDFLTYSMQPTFTAWEQELSHALLTESEQDEYYFEFHTDALLRTDSKTRNETYQLRRLMGVMSIDEVRRADNLPPIPAGGDTYIEPLNMRIVGAPDPQPKASNAP